MGRRGKRGRGKSKARRGLSLEGNIIRNGKPEANMLDHGEEEEEEE